MRDRLRLRRYSALVILSIVSLAWWRMYGLSSLQSFLFCMAVVWLGFQFFFILDIVAAFAYTNVLLAILVVLFYSMLSGLTASSLGVMNLFWHEDLTTRIAAAFFSTVFFALMFLAAFLTDPRKLETQQRLLRYLNDKRTLTQIIAENVQWSRKLVRLVWAWFLEKRWRADFKAEEVHNGETGLGSSVQDDMKRFLAVFFKPFWWFLLLPAVAPAVYAYFPRTVPTKLAGYRLPWISPSDNNVTTNGIAWIVGILVWGLGIFAGRFAIWVYVEVNRRLFGTLKPESRNDPTLWSRFDPIISAICPLPEEAWQLTVRGQVGEGLSAERESDNMSRKVQLQQTIIRYASSIFVVYFFGVIFNALLGTDWTDGRGRFASTMPERLISIGGWAGVAVFLISLLGMIQFLRKHAWALREEVRGNLDRGEKANPLQQRHLALALGLGVGLALAGLRSAVFQVFVVLSVVSVISIAVDRFSDTWNWPLRAYPLRVLIPFALVLVLWWTNSSPSKLRIPGLEGAYNRRVAIQKVVDERVGASPDDDEDVLKAWECVVRTSAPGGLSASKPKLAVLAVSGGANRAAFWTAEVIEKLDSLPGFRTQLRLITGASGGMVGTAHYVVALNESLQSGATSQPRPGWLVDRIPADSLSPVVRQWMLGDVPLSFWPADQGHSWDRGVALERAWPMLRVNFQSLASLERQGRIPSIVFSPMLVEDGRQLLISNLNLGFLSHARGNLLNSQDHVYSYPAVEFFKLFPDEVSCFEIATAVRLNASFPYVSPALYLPTDPYRRVVDAGYYDNYGIAVAASWIYHHRKWLMEHASGVVLIQVRAYPKQIDRKSLREHEPSVFNGLSRAFQFATSPAEGAANSRDAATLFRNDQVLDALDKWFKDQVPRDRAFFTTVLFENVLDVGMTWYTTAQELALIKIGFGEDPQEARSIVDSILLTAEQMEHYSSGMEKNRSAFKELQRWWSQR